MPVERPQLPEGVLASICGPRPVPWLVAAAVDWAVIVLIFVIVARLNHPVAYALAVFPLGSRQQALGALFHDAAHRLVLRNRFWNDALGSALAAFPLGLTLGGYRRYHFAHHRALGTPDDPEITHKSTLRQWRLPASPLGVVRDFASDLLGGGLPHLVAAGGLTRPVSLPETACISVFWGVVFAVAYALHALWVPLLFVVSIATVFWSGVRLRIWTEHLGCLDTHRIHVPWWLSHAIMPHNIGLHWEHHHFPQVPFSNLPKLRTLLLPGHTEAPPILHVGDLLTAFLRSAPLPSGHIAQTIGRDGHTQPTAADMARSATELTVLRALVHVALPLWLGVCTYATCRSTLPRALSWFPLGGRCVGCLPERFVDVFPDAAWAYALTALVMLLWGPKPGTAGRLWIGSTVLVAAGWELGQRYGVVPGQFDWADLVFGVAACILAMFCCSVTPPAFAAAPDPKGT
jgi:fatty acid desaturase